MASSELDLLVFVGDYDAEGLPRHFVAADFLHDDVGALRLFDGDQLVHFFIEEHLPRPGRETQFAFEVDPLVGHDVVGVFFDDFELDPAFETLEVNSRLSPCAVAGVQHEVVQRVFRNVVHQAVLAELFRVFVFDLRDLLVVGVEYSFSLQI